MIQKVVAINESKTNLFSRDNITFLTHFVAPLKKHLITFN